MPASVVHVDEDQPPVLIDEPPTLRRSRRPLDAARLAFTLTGMVLVVVLSLTASRTVAGIEGDLNEASALVPGWLLLPLTLVSAFATLTVWIGFVGLEIAQRRGRTAAEMVLAGVLTATLLGALSVFVQSDLAGEGLANAFRPATTGLVFPTSAAATIALVSIVGWVERPWVQRLSLIAVVGGVLDLLLGGQVTPQGAAFALLLGRAVALVVRLVSGVPTDRPDGVAIASGLRRRGIDVRSLTAVNDAWPRIYAISTPDAQLDVVVLDRDREGTGLLSNSWQWLTVARRHPAAGEPDDAWGHRPACAGSPVPGAGRRAHPPPRRQLRTGTGRDRAGVRTFFGRPAARSAGRRADSSGGRRHP